MTIDPKWVLETLPSKVVANAELAPLFTDGKELPARLLLTFSDGSTLWVYVGGKVEVFEAANRRVRPWNPPL